MRMKSSFAMLADGTLPASFEGLKSHIDIEWIRTCLKNSGVATVRKRKLTVEQLVWLVIGISLYRDRPISEVVNRLNLALPDEAGKRQQVTLAAVIKARNMVGPDPLENLFHTTAEQWALASADRLRWHGMMVLGADGTTMRIPDTKENREEFGLPGSSRATAGYPQIRAVGLMVLRSHLLLDFDFSGYHTGETTLAVPLIEKVPDNTVTILDRGFVNYLLWYRISAKGKNRNWLARAKMSQKGHIVRKFGRGDFLVEFEFPPALRREHPDLPATFQARAVQYRRKGYRAGTLLTSLLDPIEYPAAEIAELYHERWELELAFDEIKTHQLERLESIRSEAPERVKQELWGLAIAFNLIRQEMEAAARSVDLPPRRISFIMSLRLIRDLFSWAATASPGSLPLMLKDLRFRMTDLILEPRRSDRHYRRHVKIKMSGYSRNNGHPA